MYLFSFLSRFFEPVILSLLLLFLCLLFQYFSVPNLVVYLLSAVKMTCVNDATSYNDPIMPGGFGFGVDPNATLPEGTVGHSGMPGAADQAGTTAPPTGIRCFPENQDPCKGFYFQC